MMVKDSRTHAAKHASSKRTEVNAEAVTVEFSPEVKETLMKVLAAVRYSPHFDDNDELIDSLRHLAEGKQNAAGAMNLMVHITNGIERHTRATNDDTADAAWSQFRSELIDPPDGHVSFMLVQEQRGQSRK